MKREKPNLRSTHRGVAQLALPKWLSVWLLLTRHGHCDLNKRELTADNMYWLGRKVE